MNASVLDDNVTIHKEGVYIRFPSRTLAIKSRIKIYLPALTKINVVYLTKDESLKAQGPLQYTKCASLNPHINVWHNNIKVFSKFMLALSSCLPPPRWIA
jgi:hypothetical protein